MSLINSAIANSIAVIPRPVVKKISARYIAGDTLDDAVATVRDLLTHTTSSEEGDTSYFGNAVGKGVNRKCQYRFRL